MRRSNIIVGACLCGLAFVGAALLEATRNVHHHQQHLPLYSISAAYTPKLKLWPLDGLDVATFLICAVCLSLAGGAGIGGGAVLVPCFILVRGWPTSIAVAMSNVTVLGGSLANFICNVNRHRPDGTRTIDWELILMMEPTTIAGALLGAILNKLLPNYLTTYLLTIFITFMAVRLYQKGRQAYAKETDLLKSAKHAAKSAAKAAAAAAAEGQLNQDYPVWQQQQQDGGSGSEDPRNFTRNLTIRTKSSRSDPTRNISRSFRDSFSQSFSRLNAPLLADLARSYTPTAAAAAAAAVQSWRQQQQGVEFDQAQPVSSPFGVGDHTPHQNRRNSGLRVASQQQLLDLATCAVLCQGDVINNGVEPIVAVPLISELSSSSSEGETAAAAAGAAAAAADLESGYTDDADDLQQPLLAAGPQAGSSSSGSSRDAYEDTDRVPDHDLDQRSYSSDVLMVVNDLNHSDLDRSNIYQSSKEAHRVGSTVHQKANRGSAKDLFMQQQQQQQQHGWDHAVQDAVLNPQTPKPPASGASHKQPNIPLPHFATLLFLSAWVVATDIAQSNTVCGSWQYWAVTLSVLAPVTIILLVFRQILLRKYRHDDLAPGQVLPEGMLHWTSKTTLLYPALCSSAGLIAGLFGIGGGVVKGPLMLELGVPPDVAAAASATMIMFTAGSACVVYSRFGQLLLDYGVAMIVMGFLVTLCSQLLTFILIKMLGRRSVIIFMMVVLMSMACSIMLLESVQETLKIIANPDELKHFGHLCPNTKGGLGCFVAKSIGNIWAE